MKSLRLHLGEDAFRQFSWTFLRHEAAREIRRISVFIVPLTPSHDMTRYYEELVHDCSTLAHRQGGEPLELDFAEGYFPIAFGLRVIEGISCRLKGSGCALTFRIRTQRDSGELTLDESAYSVEVDDTTTRYTSVNSGVVVEVCGDTIVIQSTAEVPHTKPKTNEGVSPVMQNGGS
ncbi:hypothetical protein AAVH_18321 [Aphelenchoides avenae]|nr:hypothetical protein AAVH_18321 [Aphelenchus avenae]